MALIVLTPRLHLNGTWQGLIGASALIGLFLSSFIMGQVSDRIGRQKIFLFNFALITAASLCQLFARTATDLFIIRLIIGFGLGGDYSVGVTLLSEVVPHSRVSDRDTGVAPLVTEDGSPRRGASGR